MSARSSKSPVTPNVAKVPTIVAPGSGVSCSILLAEPNIFLSGLGHDGHGHHDDQGGATLLRGKLQLRVTKNVKIKAVQLKLVGRGRTEWPEGIPPLRQDTYEEDNLHTQVLNFFNAMDGGCENEYGNQCTYNLETSFLNCSTLGLNQSSSSDSLFSYRINLPTKEMKRLLLRRVQPRRLQKDGGPMATTTQTKGYKTFYPGTYDYYFELPIDHYQLETTELRYGSVSWVLHANVDRASAFKPTLHVTNQVSIVRVPDQLSLEMSEPISISRQWEDKLHYDIVISGRSFPIGSRIPIAFKLTPLAKVHVHKLKVYVTESIEYWTNDRRATRKDSDRKILLLEKVAGKPLDSIYASSDVRTIRGGELNPELRRQALEVGARRRTTYATRRHTYGEALSEPTVNLLGDLELGVENLSGPTEIEANVQIPTCEMMAKNKNLRLHPNCSWKNVNVYHWIKVVMGINRLDPDDATGTKHRDLEISIDSPFTVLNCRAAQVNTNLPAYSGADFHGTTYQFTCGCPGAFMVPADVPPSSFIGTLPGVDASIEGLSASPQVAHLANSVTVQQEPRPIRLLQVPSFDPPVFEDEASPPPAAAIEAPNEGIRTPPPQYDVVVGTPSVDGLADYFARLADAGFEGPEVALESAPHVSLRQNARPI
ncbi:putative arrestin-related trafficking adapter [Fusarium oxysporum f. sp. raphani]|uniref:Putative arrestin-related trafficking adapter n=1 Tax=Fusarium oxysporum f. sp. raphani TaxID=96318 RepID=A0A8J5NNA6_FUSOX|nr:putative arrestin-related trafficking adapter [Fusarium oxysporum f. sp. raphani]